MPNTTQIAAAIRARIAASPIELVVVYPTVRPVVVSTSPGAAPVSPLTGVAPAPAVGSTETPSAPNVTVRCLWVDAARAEDYRAGAHIPSAAGWQEHEVALARVDSRDVELGGGLTVFDGADHIECRGKWYRISRVAPEGPSFSAPYTYTAWFTAGATY
jgi:hypothetical protein